MDDNLGYSTAPACTLGSIVLFALVVSVVERNDCMILEWSETGVCKPQEYTVSVRRTDEGAWKEWDGGDTPNCT